MAKGGPRKGAGRPKGSITRPQFRDYVSEKEVSHWLEVLKDQAVQDNKLLIWALDQYFGKALQAVEGDITSKGERLEISDEQFKQAIKAALTRDDSDKSSS